MVDLCGTADDASNIYLVFEPCFGGDLYKRLAHRGLYEEAQLCKEVRRLDQGPLSRCLPVVRGVLPSTPLHPLPAHPQGEAQHNTSVRGPASGP